MKKDMTALATKSDIKALRMDNKQLLQKFAETEKRLKLYFDAAVKNITGRVDMINTEKIFEHDAAILQLQIHTGLRQR